MKKTLLQVKKENELKRLKKLSNVRLEAKVKYAHAQLELEAIRELYNKARRDAYNYYKKPIKNALAEVEHWQNILIKN